MSNIITYSGGTLTDASIFGGVDFLHNINPDEDINVGYTCSASIKFVTNTALVKGTVLTWKMDNFTAGKFIVDKVEKKSNKYTITAYDNINLFEQVVDSWVESITYPTTVQQLFTGLCTAVGVTAASGTITNGTYSVASAPFRGYNINGRTILKYIAGIAGGFACALPDGTIAVKTFTDKTSTVSIGNSEMTKCEISDASVPLITGVRAGTTEDDIGHSVGTSDVQLAIIGNPLLTGDDITTSVLPNILTNVRRTYYPAEFSLLDMTNFGTINAGDIIKVYGNPVIIFEKHYTKSGYDFVSTGNLEREIGVDTVSKIESLQGQTAVFRTDINGIHSEVTNLDGRTSLLEQDVGGITIEIAEIAETADEAKETAETADTKATQAKATADGLAVTVSSHTTAIDGLDTRVDDAETTLEQHADEIALKASQSSVDDLDGRVDDAEAELIVQAGQIALKASQSALDALDGRVEDAEAEIEVQAGQIALKASQSSVDDLEGRMDDAEAELVVQAGQISTKVSSNGVISSINQSPESVTINANKVNLSGYVTFSNLSTAGQTTINGSNVTTGTIDASQATITNINASNITTGVLDADNINVRNLNGQSIKDGTIAGSKIDTLSANKLTAGKINGSIIQINDADITSSLTIRNPDGEAPSDPITLSNDEYGLNIFRNNSRADVTLGTVDADDITVDLFTSKCLQSDYISVRDFLVDIDDYIYNHTPEPFYYITISTSPSSAGDVYGAGGYHAGDRVVLDAVPYAHYQFDGWYLYGALKSRNARYEFTMPASSDTYTAKFVSYTPSYTISTGVNIPGSGSVIGGGTYNEGATCTLIATSSIGYSFEGWYKNGVRISTSTSYSFTVSADAYIEAHFTFTGHYITLDVSSDWGAGDYYWATSPGGNLITELVVDDNDTVSLYFCRECDDLMPVGENGDYVAAPSGVCSTPAVTDFTDDYAEVYISNIRGNFTLTAYQGG